MLIIMPTLVSFAALMGILLCWRHTRGQRLVNLVGTAAYCFFAMLLCVKVSFQHYVTLQVGGWSAPFGISLCADWLGALMVMLTGIIALAVSVYSLIEVRLADVRAGFYIAFQVLLIGLAGVFLTADLFNLYVWFEVILMSSFILLVLSGSKFQLEAAVKYAVLSLIATLLLLAAIAFLYAMTGTLNFADLAVKVQQSLYPGFLNVIAVLFVIAFGMKAAMFPLFFWLPASYHTTRYSTSALFSALLSKVGIYALIRVFTLIFVTRFAFAHTLLLVLAILTLIVGMAGAIARYRLRQVLSFTLVSHIGYMLLGIGFFNLAAMTGAIYYMLQHMVVIALLFMLAGLIKLQRRCCTGSLYRSRPYLALLFFIAILAIAGVPPFSGFWPKLVLIQGAIQAHLAWVSLLLLLISLSTLYVMLRLWHHIFFSVPETVGHLFQIKAHAMWAACWALGVGVLALSLFPEIFYHLAADIGMQLMYPAGYMNAVLGGGVL